LLAQLDYLLHNELVLQGIFFLLRSLLIVSLAGFSRAVRTVSACPLTEAAYLTPGRFGTRLFSDFYLEFSFRHGNQGLQGCISERISST
jgi:hypothetical protein